MQVKLALDPTPGSLATQPAATSGGAFVICAYDGERMLTVTSVGTCVRNGPMSDITWNSIVRDAVDVTPPEQAER